MLSIGRSIFAVMYPEYIRGLSIRMSLLLAASPNLLNFGGRGGGGTSEQPVIFHER